MASAAWTGPNFKTLTACLMGGFLLKIGLSAPLLLPRAWLLDTGPRPSEAATSETGDSVSLPRLLSLVEKERRALLAREAAATAKEEHLNQLKKEVEERLRELQSLQNRLLETLEEEKRLQGEHNRHLVATLQAMSPDRAGKLLEKMEEEEAVRLLRRLPGKEAGAILSLLSPEKAARLSHRLLK